MEFDEVIHLNKQREDFLYFHVDMIQFARLFVLLLEILVFD